MKVLVTGATGGLGREILSAPRIAGVVIRAQTRRPLASVGGDDLEWVQSDLATGKGLAPAVAGVDAIIHTATDPRHSKQVDVEGTRRLVEAAESAGVRHFIFISIVGIDQIPLAYYRRKLAAEQCVIAGRVPYSLLRATQFHSLIDVFVAWAARVPFVMPLPTRFLFQSVATAEVARRLMRCLDEGPRGRLPDFAGPSVMTLGEAATVWKEVRGVRKAILHVPLPGALAAAFRAGNNTARNAETGTLSWRDWLIQHSTSAKRTLHQDQERRT